MAGINTDTLHSNGQIWIDKNAPHSLKYHINGVDYSVQNQVQYIITSADNVHVGSIVALDPSKESGEISDSTGNVFSVTTALRPAVFPTDSANVLGVVTGIADSTSGISVTVATDGYVDVTAEEAFPCDDFTVAENKDIILGTPVYWFTGRNAEDGTSYIYPETAPGAMTLYIPTGSSAGLGINKAEEDSTLDIAYMSLPTVGEITGYDYQDGKYTRFRVHINVKNLNNAISWIWPANNKCTAEELNAGVFIKHGLLLKGSQCYADCKVMGETADIDRISAIVCDCWNDTGTDDLAGGTKAKAKHAERSGFDFFRLCGEVYYRG